jgi:hypothetical protein
LKPSNEWRNQLHAYLRTMPAYYAGPLRRALTRMGAGNLAASLIPETLDNCLSYTVLNYLKRLRNQAKLEFERMLSVTPVTKASSITVPYPLQACSRSLCCRLDPVQKESK